MPFDSEYASIEEAWSRSSLAPAPSVPAIAASLPETKSSTIRRSTHSDPSALRVTIRDPQLIRHFDVYRDEYRDSVIERLLKKVIETSDTPASSPTQDMVREVVHTVKEGFTTFCGTSDPKHMFETALLWVWFAIAVLLFVLLARGSSS